MFTGLYRLGRFSSASFLQVHPDISVHAKLLTGGLVPLCTTLASDSIYDAFIGSEKRDALLHGHSYTAHAVGCHVANTSLNTLLEMDRSGQWQVYKEDWADAAAAPSSSSSAPSTASSETGLEVWSSWSKSFIQQISKSRDVESVFALGSVLAINLHDNERAGKSLFPFIFFFFFFSFFVRGCGLMIMAVGYNSSAAAGLQKKLLEAPTELKFHSRGLGNVFYLMASQTSTRETLQSIERLLLDVLS